MFGLSSQGLPMFSASHVMRENPMKKCCLLFAVLLFPLLAMADYELDGLRKILKSFMRAVFNPPLKAQVVLMQWLGKS